MDKENRIVFSHTPILLDEIIELINISPNGTYVDCTLGGAGHSYEIAKRLSNGGKLIGIDKDDDAINASKQHLKEFSNVVFVHSDFKDYKKVLEDLKINKVDGVLIDLGVSSYQIDTAMRGFSFRFEGPLDMRMDKSQAFSAYNVVNEYSYQKLTQILFDYGEEPFAKKIVAAICSAREIKPIETTKELNEIIESALPKKIVYKSGGAAKKTFQAIRIEVNKELDGLKEVLFDIVSSLKSGGRACVLSFHSLEDRIVKNVFKELSTECICPPAMPICTCGHHASIRLVNKHPIVASENEQKRNPRSTCAKLRVAEKI